MSTTEAAHLGTVLGDRYELVRHIARGGMGDVYEARDRGLSDRQPLAPAADAGTATSTTTLDQPDDDHRHNTTRLSPRPGRLRPRSTVRPWT